MSGDELSVGTFWENTFGEGGTLSTLFDGLGSTFTDLIANAAAFLSGTEVTAEDVQGIWDGFAADINEALSGLDEAFSATFSVVPEAASKFLQDVGAWWQGVYLVIKDYFTVTFTVA